MDPSALLEDPAFQGMGLEARGAWVTLVAAGWRQKRIGRFVGSDKVLAQLALCTPEEWARVKPELSTAVKVDMSTGEWVIPLLVSTYESQQKKVDKWRNDKRRQRKAPVDNAVDMPVDVLACPPVGSGSGSGSDVENQSQRRAAPAADPAAPISPSLATENRNNLGQIIASIGSAKRTPPNIAPSPIRSVLPRIAELAKPFGSDTVSRACALATSLAKAGILHADLLARFVEHFLENRDRISNAFAFYNPRSKHFAVVRLELSARMSESEHAALIEAEKAWARSFKAC